MTTRSFVLIALAAAGVVAMGTWQAKPTEPPTFQGWVEADFVFVGPDEPGRVETLSVREGDTVTPGAPLFTVDSDLQKAAVQQDEATLANAQQTFNRAQELLKSGVGSRKDYNYARATLNEIRSTAELGANPFNATERLRARWGHRAAGLFPAWRGRACMAGR